MIRKDIPLNYPGFYGTKSTEMIEYQIFVFLSSSSVIGKEAQYRRSD